MLGRAGFEAYVVGGCVRDSLLGCEPSDWDITTSALPEQVKEVFKRTIDTGIKHGTVTVRMNGKSYEVTTYESVYGKDTARGYVNEELNGDLTLLFLADSFGYPMEPFLLEYTKALHIGSAYSLESITDQVLKEIHPDAVVILKYAPFHLGKEEYFRMDEALRNLTILRRGRAKDNVEILVYADHRSNGWNKLIEQLTYNPDQIEKAFDKTFSMPKLLHPEEKREKLEQLSMNIRGFQIEDSQRTGPELERTI